MVSLSDTLEARRTASLKLPLKVRTVADLIAYLGRFRGDLRVVESRAALPADFEDEYLALDEMELFWRVD